MTLEIHPCACGCGKEVRNRKGGRRKLYFDGACRVRAHRRRQDVTDGTEEDASESLQPEPVQPDAPRFVEIHNFRGHGEPYGYTGPFPGIRAVEVLEDFGDRLRIRYMGPDPMEEIIPVDRVVREYVTEVTD